MLHPHQNKALVDELRKVHSTPKKKLKLDKVFAELNNMSHPIHGILWPRLIVTNIRGPDGKPMLIERVQYPPVWDEATEKLNPGMITPVKELGDDHDDVKLVRQFPSGVPGMPNKIKQADFDAAWQEATLE